MMLGQTLFVQWKWSRDFLAFFTAIGFAIPLLFTWIALPHLGFTSPRELVDVGGAIGATIGGVAAFTGVCIAWLGYGVDETVGHIYALSLPITRLRALWYRATTASVLLAIPALGMWVGATIAAGQMNLPSTLESYSGSLAIRALLASWLAHACMFALRHSAGRRAKTVLAILAGAATVVSLIAVFAPSSRDVIARIGDFMTSNPGPFGVFFGRWTLIDV
jgi:hypothetical protein